jgi:hypothetical protein
MEFYGCNRGKSENFLTRKLWVCLLIGCCLMQSAFAQQKSNRLLVYGDGFAFSLEEPPGWRGDTKSAEAFGANAILYEIAQPSDSMTGLIRIRVNSKEDEDTQADMDADMHDYQSRYPKVQFKDLPIETLGYRCLAKVFYIPGKFYEYVAYVNPGPKKPFLFSVAMSAQKSEASAHELEAYMSTVRSLTLIKP